VTNLADLRIPVAMRPTATPIIELTDRVCTDLLDEEYAALARHVLAKLARKRPSPLQAGRAATWAGGVVWALGQVNFLFDRSTGLYAAPDDLAGAFGLSKSTLGQKGKQVRDTLKMTWATPEFLRAEVIEANPMIWFIEVNGLPCDARELPVEIQAEAYRQGVIPYIPDLGRDGTAAAEAVLRS
jgi:Domain of unknown function (DUF6398)